MNDPFFMRAFERFSDLFCYTERFVDGHRSVFQPVRERVTFDELHDDALCPSRLLQTVDMRDAGMGQRRENFRLTLKPADSLRIAVELVGKNLDSDVTF